jgi:hypothetical protein
MQIAYNTHKIAQGVSPYRTGNLRHNAIFLKDFNLTRDGATWRINYSSRNARYLEPLNEGWNKKGGGFVQGRKFVESAFMNIGRYLNGMVSDREMRNITRTVRSTEQQNLSQAQKDARELEFHRSVKMNREGKVSPLTDPKEWSVFRDIR